jgi:hypothetical protein
LYDQGHQFLLTRAFSLNPKVSAAAITFIADTMLKTSNADTHLAEK